jgi:MYXO-CTERM domain-containing protein
MRNHLILPVLISTLLVPAAPAQASSATVQAQPSQTTQAALGRGFGRRTPSFGSRSRYRPRYRARPYRRPSFGIGRFFGGVLKFLGLAYLFNLLFGWGPGGSPFGLILLFGLLALVATRRRRRPVYY